MIKQSKVYSDCLFPEFIDSMNTLLNSGQYSYDSNGIKQFCEDLAKNNPKQVEFANQLQVWLKKNI